MHFVFTSVYDFFPPDGSLIVQLPDWVCVSLNFPRHLSFVAGTLAPVFSLVWLFGDIVAPVLVSSGFLLGLLPLFQSGLVLWWGCCPCFSFVWFSGGIVAPVLVSSGSLVRMLPLFQSRLVLRCGCCPCLSLIYVSGGVAAPVSVSSGSPFWLLPLFQSHHVWFSIGVVALVSVLSGCFGLLPPFQFRLVLCCGCRPCFSLQWFSVGVAAPASVTSSSLVGLLPFFQSRLVLWWGLLPLFQSRLVLWWVVALVSVSSGSLVG